MSEAILYVGIDLGNDNHAICVVNDVGKVVKQQTVKNDFGAFQAMQSLIGTIDPARVRVAVEDKHNALTDMLLAHRFQVFTINPKQVDRFRERNNVAGAKDDRRDARVLSSTLRSDAELYRRVELPSDDVVALRSSIASLESLDSEGRILSNQLRACVLRYFPTLLTLCAGADEPWFWDLLKLLTSTSIIDDAAVGKLLKLHRKRKVTVQVVIDAVRERRLTPGPGVAEAGFSAAKLLIERLELIRRHRDIVTTERDCCLAKMSGTKEKASDVDIVNSMPGFGPKNTATFVTRGIPALRAGGLGILRGLSGAAPVTKRSGKSHVVQMRRACDPHLRDALYHAAAAASIWDDNFKKQYGRLREAGHGHARALRNIALRLLRILDAMLRNRTLYRDPTALAQPT